MSFMIPKVDADIHSPVEKSCNCCDVISCYLFCCTKKEKSPLNKRDKQVSHISKEKFSEIKINTETKDNK